MLAVCWWIRSFLAAIFRNSCSSLLLLALFLCQRGCSYRSYVHGILVSSKRFRDPTISRSCRPLVPLESYGWAYALRDRVSACFLWGGVRASCKMVGLWILDLRCQSCHLAWCWRGLVEGHWLVVDMGTNFSLFWFLLHTTKILVNEAIKCWA